MKKFSPSQFKLMYITQQREVDEIKNEINDVLNGGCKWIQIRMKESTIEEIEAVSVWAKEACCKHNAILIINDHPEVALKAQADGVHLGKNDISAKIARDLLGPEKIIGITVNHSNDLDKAAVSEVDYLGIGPYKFTTTKKNLSAIIGINGYTQIKDVLKLKNVNMPWVAIGGIELADLPHLQKAGIQNVAVSSAIGNSKNRINETSKFIALLNN